MKTLHSVVNVTNILWPTLPCLNDYHIGYQHERRTGDSHSTCFGAAHADSNIHLCECTPCCNGNYLTHYYMTPVGEDAYRPNFGYMCEPCTTEVHPVRP